MYSIQARNVVALLATTVLIYTCSSTCAVRADELIDGTHIFHSSTSPLESKLRGNQMLMNQQALEEAVLIEQAQQQQQLLQNGQGFVGLTPREEIVRNVQREVVQEIVRENQQLNQVVDALNMQTSSPFHPFQAATWAREIVRGQTHGQLTTFLTGATAFQKSLVGSPVSSVEMFVEDCQMGNGDLLVVASELSARNLQTDESRATLLIQGNMLESMSPRMQQIAMEMNQINQMVQPQFQKTEVVLVGHMQKIDMLSDMFLSAKQCIERVHPELQILEKVMPQRFGVWRFKIDSGVHMIDNMHKFIGWVPLEKYQQYQLFSNLMTGDRYHQQQQQQRQRMSEMMMNNVDRFEQPEGVFFNQIQSNQFNNQRFYPSELRQRFEYPINGGVMSSSKMPIEFEVAQQLKELEVERMVNQYQNGFQTRYSTMTGPRVMSPIARKLVQLRNVRQAFPVANGQTYPRFFNNQFNGVQQPTIVL